MERTSLAFIQDLLAAIGVFINGIPQGILALSFGFAAFPTALGFIFSAIVNTFTKSVAPVSFQVETITVAGTKGDNRRDRTAIILHAALLITVDGFRGCVADLL